MRRTSGCTRDNARGSCKSAPHALVSAFQHALFKAHALQSLLTVTCHCVCASPSCVRCRLIQEPGTFVVLLPNAFHSWVSTGFSIHESVALAPWDCLGAGCDAERSSRQQRHPTAVSQTELLVTLVRRQSCWCTHATFLIIYGLLNSFNHNWWQRVLSKSVPKTRPPPHNQPSHFRLCNCLPLVSACRCPPAGV